MKFFRRDCTPVACHHPAALPAAPRRESDPRDGGRGPSGLSRPLRLAVAILLSPALSLAWVFSPEVSAGESIRVAVRDGMSAIYVRSKTSLFIKDPEGRLLYPANTGAFHIRLRDGGFIINETRVRTPVLRIVSPADDLEADGQSFRGLIEVRQKDNSLTIINEVDVEEYLKGVVPEEMAYHWHPEALKIQAIIARTYALYRKQQNLGRPYDLVSTVRDQVYQGADRERLESSRAVAETDGLVVAYGGDLALTLYHSTSAGRTRDIREAWGIDLPYLRGVECPFDEESPYYRWQRKISLDEFENSLRQHQFPVGSLATLTPFRWGRDGRVMEIRILHSGGELYLQGEEARKVAGYKAFPSTHFRVDRIGQEIFLSGKGYGHGIGLCQWGAKVQAEQGKSFREVLQYYYPGVQVVDYRVLASNDAGDRGRKVAIIGPPRAGTPSLSPAGIARSMGAFE